MIKKYGVDNISKLDKTKQKVKATKLNKYENGNYSIEAMEKTCLEKYKNKTYIGSADYKKKTTETNQKLHKCNWNLERLDVKEKSRQTCLERYGVEYSSKNSLIKEKTKTTNQKRYGGNAPIFDSRVKQKIVNTKKTFARQFKKRGFVSRKELIKKFGVSWLYSNIVNFILYKGSSYVSINDVVKIEKYLEENKRRSISAVEKELVSEIKKIYFGEIITNTRKVISPYELDIYMPEKKLAVEFNGIYWHSDKFRDTNYHLNKLKMCKDKEIILIQIFENEWYQDKENILQLIKNKINGVREFYSSEIELDLFKHSILEYPDYRVAKVPTPKLINIEGFSIWNCGTAIMKKFNCD